MNMSVTVKTSFSVLLLMSIAIFYSCQRVSGDPPVAGFTYTSVSSIPLPATVQFINTSITSGGTATYEWDFGDGTAVTTVSNPTHIYTQPLVYLVRLVQTQSTGPRDTITQILNLASFWGPSGSSNRVSSPGFTVVLPDRIFNTTFTNISTGASKYIWSFGDGLTSTTDSTTVIHVFDAGTFHVNLTATNDNGVDTSGATINF